MYPGQQDRPAGPCGREIQRRDLDIQDMKGQEHMGVAWDPQTNRCDRQIHISMDNGKQMQRDALEDSDRIGK